MNISKIIGLCVALICMLGSLVTHAQMVVKVKPEKPKVVVVKPAKPKQGHVWRAGHWKWNGTNYGWVKSHWVKTRVGHNWMAGHWVVAKGRP